MKRNYYPNYKNWMEHPNSESSKQRNEQRMKILPRRFAVLTVVPAMVHSIRSSAMA